MHDTPITVDGRVIPATIKSFRFGEDLGRQYADVSFGTTAMLPHDIGASAHMEFVLHGSHWKGTWLLVCRTISFADDLHEYQFQSAGKMEHDGKFTPVLSCWPRRD